MKQAAHGLLLLFVALLCPVDAMAQPPIDVSPSVAFPKWDTSATWGVGYSNNHDVGAFQDNGEGFSVWTLDVGRYLTRHLKGEASLMLARSQFGGSRRFPTTDLPAAAVPTDVFLAEIAYTTVRPTSLAGTVTYQFRDNEFTHPYVSAGVRTIWQARHMTRDEETIRVRGFTYRIPAIDERTTSVGFRPFVAFGCKSYFNRSVFMRSEVLVALGPSGYSHSTLRLGTGADF